jgi:hypothetical protein
LLRRILYLFAIGILSIGCADRRHVVTVLPADIENGAQYTWRNDHTLFPFTGNVTITSRQYSLNKGKFSMRFRAYGNRAENRLPKFSIKFGEYEIAELDIDVSSSLYTVNFELPYRMACKFAFTFNDDYNKGKEDRNVFLIFPVIVVRY